VSALFIVLQVLYEALASVASRYKAVVLNFHTKREHQWLTSGADWPGVSVDLPSPLRGHS